MKPWKTITRMIAATMLLGGTCCAAQEVTLLEKDGLQMVVRLPDAFDAANPGIIAGIRNTRPDPLRITRGEPSQAFRLSLYDSAGKEIPAEKSWAARNDPRLNDAGLRAPGEIAASGRLDSPTFPLAKVFGERWREGVRLEVEWFSGVSRLKQPAGWWLAGSIDLRALKNDSSLVMTATPDRALEKIEGAKTEEELIRLAMVRLKEDDLQIPEGLKPWVHYRDHHGTYVSMVWAWKDEGTSGERSVYVGIDRVSGKILDFINPKPKK